RAVSAAGIQARLASFQIRRKARLMLACWFIVALGMSNRFERSRAAVGRSEGHGRLRPYSVLDQRAVLVGARAGRVGVAADAMGDSDSQGQSERRDPANGRAGPFEHIDVRGRGTGKGVVLVEVHLAPI